MSERIAHSVDDTKGSGRQSKKSSWMPHWMRIEKHNNINSENEEIDNASKDNCLATGLMEVPKSVKGFGFIETRNIKSKLGLGEGVNCKTVIEFPSVVYGIPAAEGGEGTSMNPLEGLNKTRFSAKDNSVVASKSLQETLIELSSQMVVPQRLDLEKLDFGKGKSTKFSNNHLPNANLGMLNGDQSADLVRKRKMDSPSKSDNLTSACFKKINTMLLFGVPSTSNHRIPQEQERFQKTQKCSSIRLFPNQCTSEKTKSKKSMSDRYSLKNLPNCVHDVETMRTCTMVDSAEGTSEGCPKFSQKTHSLLIRQKIDVNLSKENDFFKSKKVLCKKIDENTSSNLPNLSPNPGPGNLETKPRTLSSSIDSEGKGNGHGSSAETDIMDMDLLEQKNSHTGTDSTGSTKEFNMESTLPPKVNVSSSKNMCQSSSRTKSLDIDTLLVNSKQPKLNLGLSLDNSIEAEDPSYRWVKRLKSTSKTSSLGIKSSYLNQNLPHEKMSKSFSRIIKNNMTASEPKEDEDIFVDPSTKNKELLFSHAWIARWMSNESKITQKKSEKVGEPQSSILVVEDLAKKQFPSIAAMALMGKGMKGFQKCELQKKGSFTVWNTKAL